MQTMQVTLKAARVNKGLTQAVAADRIGVSVETLQNWEAAKTFPSVPQIQKIEQVYGVAYGHIKFLP